jgi:hypothetical protein
MILFYFLVHSGFFGFLVLPTISGCTARVEWLYFSLSSIWTSSRMTGLFYFFTFEICRFSCTSYNKWLYCSCRMVVLLIIKYFNFLMNDEIILFFVLSILSGCTVPNGCTSYRQAFELLLKWRDYFIFSTFVFCLFSCTFYIKWVVLLMWNGCTSPRHIFEGAHSLHIKRNIWKIKDEVCTLLCELLLDILLFILHFTKNFALSKLIICPSSSHHLYFSES